jgi:hypothetical protein
MNLKYMVWITGMSLAHSTALIPYPEISYERGRLFGEIIQPRFSIAASCVR